MEGLSACADKDRLFELARGVAKVDAVMNADLRAANQRAGWGQSSTTGQYHTGTKSDPINRLSTAGAASKNFCVSVNIGTQASPAAKGTFGHAWLECINGYCSRFQCDSDGRPFPVGTHEYAKYLQEQCSSGNMAESLVASDGTILANVEDYIAFLFARDRDTTV